MDDAQKGTHNAIIASRGWEERGEGDNADVDGEVAEGHPLTGRLRRWSPKPRDSHARAPGRAGPSQPGMAGRSMFQKGTKPPPGAGSQAEGQSIITPLFPPRDAARLLPHPKCRPTWQLKDHHKVLP